MRLPFMQPPAVKTETEWQDCVEYLNQLSQQDYNKMLKVVQIYRDADKAVKKVLGIKENLSDNLGWQPAATHLAMHDTDTEIGDFLDDDEPKSKKVEVK